MQYIVRRTVEYRYLIPGRTINPEKVARYCRRNKLNSRGTRHPPTGPPEDATVEVVTPVMHTSIRRSPSPAGAYKILEKPFYDNNVHIKGAFAAAGASLEPKSSYTVHQLRRWSDNRCIAFSGTLT
jgi:hypothetical protein